MASPVLPKGLRGLVLSAVDLRNMTQWPDALIEDYLNIVDNLVAISNEINTKASDLENITLVSVAMSPYTILATDKDVFFQTSGGNITANLPAGISGQNFRLVSVGNVGNRVTVNPNGAEKIFGTTTEYIADKEELVITYSTVEGWN